MRKREQTGRIAMKKLLVYLKDYKKESILGPLFKLLEASFELIIPLVVASMIDVGIANSDKGYVGKMCLIMAILGFTGLISAVTAQYFAAKAAVGFATKRKSGAASVSAFPVYRVWRNGDGLYRRCESSAYFCSGHSPFVYCGIRGHVGKYSAF